MKLIGTGTYTKAYLMDNGRVRLHTNDPVKEAMGHGWFPDSELFPKIEYIGYEEHSVRGRTVDYHVYEMDYYPQTKGLKEHLDADQWAIYKTLRKIFLSGSGWSKNPYDWHQKTWEQFNKIENEEVREALQEAATACSNYGTKYQFEISPRNVRAKDGKLVLLDCFFFPKEQNPELF